MKDNTKQRIEYYRDALPGMRQKVMGAAMMLLVAMITAVTATYAWITLSVSPEVADIATTVTSNGSLEIALADGTGEAPGSSAEGDSTAAGTNVLLANTTWGNLVNLSDPSYGLTNITLRPAALNGTSGLLTSPLYGVSYGEDGRASKMTTEDDFAYVYYNSSEKRFLADIDGTNLGVRAISTVQYENLEGDNTLSELLKNVNENLTLAKNNYSQMTDTSSEPGKSYISSLEGLMQVYAQNQIDRKSTSELNITQYVENLYAMLQYLNDNVMEPSGESYVQMANMLELMKGSGKADAGYTVDTLCSAALSNSLPSYIGNNISSLKQFATDRKNMATYLLASTTGDYSDLTTSQKNNSLAYWAYYAQNGGTVYWSNINTIVNWVCDINSCTVDGYPMSSIGNLSTVNKILNKSGTHEAVINKGALYRVEQRIGKKMAANISITVDASSLISLAGKQTLSAVVTTSAEDPYEMVTDRDTIKAMNTGSFKGDTATAEDTYAMALDLWIRTNAGSSERESESSTVTDADGNTTTTVTAPEAAYLTLEGKEVTSVQEVQATITDGNGDKQPAYIASFTVEGKTIETEVFKRYGSYYYIDEETGNEVLLESELEDDYGSVPEITYTEEMTEGEAVVGYEGENRVWTEDQMTEFSGSGTSTTQGNGSCYVFYADTPSDQTRFLNLLSAMKVSFVNKDGRQIGVASMDTEHYYAENGKVTVPLVLDTTMATNLGIDIDGNTIYGMMPLTKGAATRITAIIYLDGTKLTNGMVLANGDIQGSLNIQFGCTTATQITTTVEDAETGETETDVEYTQGTASSAIRNEEVMDDFIAVTASVTKDSFDYDPDQTASTTVNVNVTGIQPQSVSIRFIRAISSTQGALQEMVNLSGSGSSWNGTYSFNKPGTYILRSVWVDGVEYTLEEPQTVTVTGSSVNSLTCDAITDGRSATVLTADSSYSTNVTLGFATSNSMPNSVKGMFMDANGRQVNVTFTKNKDGVTWSGKATFTSSATYTMSYVEIDGNIYELSESLQPTLEVLLGLKVRTWITVSDETLAKLQEKDASALATRFTLTEDVTLNVAAEIYDNSGNEIMGLDDVTLIYGKSGSALKKLDGNLKWDTGVGRYSGEFLVHEAGTYKFSSVTVGNNTITNATSAPNIQAMPPEDVSYFNNYTETYQYAPQLNAKMTIGLAYSSAASKVEATINNGTNSFVVEGEMGHEAEDQGDKTVNLWSFKVPEINSSQEGEWKLTSITLYDVYYGGQYYAEENGATIDVSSEEIKTKVINYIYATLKGNSQEFSGYFMDDHKVSGMTVTIADYEGNAIQNVTVSDVKVMYQLDASSVSLANYGYTADGLEIANVSGGGTLKSGSTTEYEIETMNFQYAGLYKDCTVSFALNGTSFTAGSGTIKLSYADGGSLSESAPTYEVHWTAPTVEITGVSPAASEELTIVVDSSHNATVHNYYESFYANVYGYKETNLVGWISGNNTYEVSTVTLKLTNAGSKFASTTFLIPNPTSGFENTITFTSNNSSKTSDVGGTDNYGGSRRLCGTQKISTVTMTYGGKDFTVKLSDMVTINEGNSALPSLTYTGLEDHSAYVQTPATYTGNEDGRAVKVTLPSLDDWVATYSEGNDTVISNEKTTTSGVCYYTSSGSLKKTYTYYQYNRTTTTWTETAAVDYYTATYRLSGWKIDGKTYAPGTEVTISAAKEAEAVIEIVDRTYVKTESQSRTGTTILDTSAGTSTSTSYWGASLPSGYKTDVGSKDNLYLTAETTYTEWK